MQTDSDAVAEIEDDAQNENDAPAGQKHRRTHADPDNPVPRYPRVPAAARKLLGGRSAECLRNFILTLSFRSYLDQISWTPEIICHTTEGTIEMMAERVSTIVTNIKTNDETFGLMQHLELGNADFIAVLLLQLQLLLLLMLLLLL